MMPPARNPNYLCKVCLKPYNSSFWLDRHINLEHPWYRAEVAAEDERAKSSLERPIGDPKSRFHDNHDDVDDRDAFPLFNEPHFDLPSSPKVAESIPTTYTFPDAGQPDNPPEGECYSQQCFDNPFYPFDSEEEYNFAELVTSKGLPANVIDALLKGNCGLKDSLRASLKSNYRLRQKIDAMEDGLGHGSWKKASLDMGWNEQHPDPIEFWWRDLIECVKWLLRQPAYEEHLTYAPKRCYNDMGQRIYNEMHTGDMWWEKQVSGLSAIMAFIWLTIA